MTIFSKELKQGVIPLAIWSVASGFMIAVCILMFPELKGQVNDINNMFSNMGSFTSAFGMDKVNFGEIIGFYAVECGNILSIGGCFFAAFVGITILSKEEKEHTAEFLLTHPVSRFSVLIQKFIAVIAEIVIFNIAVVFCSLLSFMMINESIPHKEFMLIHAAYLIAQIEIACICFGISAFIKHSGIGIGLGIAALLYFVNIIRNITESVSGLKYITPFAYADATEIVSDCKIDFTLIIIGTAIAVTFVILGFIKYSRKDINA